MPVSQVKLDTVDIELCCPFVRHLHPVQYALHATTGSFDYNQACATVRTEGNAEAAYIDRVSSAMRQQQIHDVLVAPVCCQVQGCPTLHVERRALASHITELCGVMLYVTTKHIAYTMRIC